MLDPPSRREAGGAVRQKRIPAFGRNSHALRGNPDLFDRHGPRGGSIIAFHESRTACRMNIVIVDDNAVNLMLMAALARSATGLEAHRFDDPLAGLDWCRKHGADLIVVDFMMPNMDGHQFIEAVRATAHLADVPVVMVTAAGQSAVRRRALEIGATDFLTKPVDSTEMKLRLRNLLDR